MALEEPGVVVALDEGADHFSGLLEGFEVVEADALLLERGDEALRDAVALLLAYVGGCGADAKPLDLGPELPCPVVRDPVVAQTEAQGDCLAEAADSGACRSVIPPCRSPIPEHADHHWSERIGALENLAVATSSSILAEVPRDEEGKGVTDKVVHAEDPNRRG